ncbi:hypothetical protein LRP52_37135 [Photobacterium sp. ZSDE20]|uniref:DUF7146 domain-containing protein n=1 Tax=Photobacterium pectinilyticum TaxID=2906793 RepID=A0ABT1N7U5_9GAMM|nr:hypothetical protein [Photobacterium sp. ZSDE20]MCQ1060617.1 hypothetical protein [Photobacterium sp. ZSDE20]MDD1827812.1 hypothetical protein [Photobacterium sp. ZSDE20]
MGNVDRTSVFELVNRITDYSVVYSALGLDYMVQNPKKHYPCPKANYGGNGSKSTKFRLHKHYQTNGYCIHNDINDGRYLDIIGFTEWFLDIDNVSAAKKVLECAGVHYEDDGHGVGNFTIPKPDPEVLRRQQEKLFNDGQFAIKMIAKTWSESVSVREPEAEQVIQAYFAKRGVPDVELPETIRFHPRLLYPKGKRAEGNKESHAFYPGLLIPMIDEHGRRVTFHRMWFMPDGNMIDEPQRKMLMMAPWQFSQGSYLEYDNPLQWTDENGVNWACIAVGEGVETMEAVKAGTGLYVQPMYNSTLLAGYQPPTIAGVKKENFLVIIFGDKDRSNGGQNAMKQLKERLGRQGYLVEHYLPTIDVPSEKSSVDFLDQWNALGAAGFPAHLAM